MLRLGWIQTLPVHGDPAANVAAVEPALLSGEADLWVLPELFSTGYLFDDRADLARVAEPVPDGPTARALVSLAVRGRCAVVAGVAERGDDGRLFNSAIALDGGGVRAVYRKVHLFDLERRLFDPGDLPFPVLGLAGARVGLMICYDWRFPEAARTLALAGAQVIAHPSDIVQPHCQAAMVTRALENRVFTVTANRVGTEERGDHRVEFTGGSRVVGPDGRVLSDGPVDRPASGVAEIDPAEADDKRATATNDLFADRRPEMYRIDQGAASARARGT
ncbi:MAG: acyltransferase [Deltaproteobacteria bacterium]|nr:acyltransferase [Deltaproteobacteria bacterium]